MNADPVAGLIEAHRLPAAYREVVAHHWHPLATAIARRAANSTPLIVGINGAQGSGKSTLCAFLEVLLRVQGLRTVTLSLDDIYLGRADRAQLAAKVHPLFATRGVPGTHAPAMGLAIIEAVLSGHDFDLPRFDKGADERVDAALRISGPVDVLLFEGWCVGCRPQADEDLLEPVNSLEAEEDPEGIWRSVSNLWLRGDYARLFGLIDMLVMLKVDSFETVIANRLKQEEKLRAARPDAAHLMDEVAIRRFCQHFERLTRHMLQDLPPQADVVFELGPDQVPLGPPILRQAGLASGQLPS